VYVLCSAGTILNLLSEVALRNRFIPVVMSKDFPKISHRGLVSSIFPQPIIYDLSGQTPKLFNALVSRIHRVPQHLKQ